MNHPDKPDAVELLASGSAIEMAIKVSMLVKNSFKNGVHQIMTTNLHLTEKGEPLHEANIVDQQQLHWMMKGSGLSQNATCLDRFQFTKSQRVTPCIKITLSTNKLDSSEIGYHRPSVPVLTKKLKSKGNDDGVHK